MSNSIRVLMVRLDGLTSTFEVDGDNMDACRRTAEELRAPWARSCPVAKVFFARERGFGIQPCLDDMDLDLIRSLPQ